jgi:hypothetical protein
LQQYRLYSVAEVGGDQALSDSGEAWLMWMRCLSLNGRDWG